jgi:hypothetical protein
VAISGHNNFPDKFCFGREQRKTSVKVHSFCVVANDVGTKINAKGGRILTEKFCIAERFAEIVVRLLPAVTHDTASSALS